MPLGKPEKIKKPILGEPESIGPVAPAPAPALQTIMRQPVDPVATPRGGYGAAFRGGVETVARSMGQQALGQEAAYGGFPMPRGDRPVPVRQRQVFEANKERWREEASEEAKRLAKDTEAFGREQAFEGRHFGHDVAGAMGSGVAFLLGGALTGAALGPQAGLLAMAMPESASEQGAVEAELINKYGMSPAEAHKKSMWVFGANLPINYLLDKGLMRFLPEEGFLKKLKDAGGTKAMAKMIAGTVARQAGQEGVQEMAQENISSLAVDKELAPFRQTLKAGAVGAVTGGLMGGATAVPGGVQVARGDLAEVSPINVDADQGGGSVRELTAPLVEDDAGPKIEETPEQLRTMADETFELAQASRLAGNERDAQTLERQGRELLKFATDKTEFDALSADEKVTAPIPGVPISNIISDYLRGFLTIDEFFAGMKEATAGQTGAVTDAGMSEARAQIAAERKAARSRNKGKPEGEKENLPSMDDKAVWQRAMLNTVAPELTQQIRKGDVGEVKASSWKDKRRTIADAVLRTRGSAIEMHTQRLGELTEMLRGRLQDDFVAELAPIVESSGITKGSKNEEILGEILYYFPHDADAMGWFKSGKGKELIERVAPEDRMDVQMAAIKVRDVMIAHKNRRNAVAESFAGKSFEGLEAYLPKQERKASWLGVPWKKESWMSTGRRIEQETRPLRHVQRDGEDTGSSRVRSAREKQRTGKDYDIDFRVWSVLEDYIGDAARRIAYQPVISSSRGVTIAMREDAKRSRQQANELGKSLKEAKEISDDVMVAEVEEQIEALRGRAAALETTAHAINAVMQASYNNVSFGRLNKAMQEWQTSVGTEGSINAPLGPRAKSVAGEASARMGVAVNKLAGSTKRMFNRAKYKINIPFIVLRQWTSSGQAWGFEGVKLVDIGAAWKDVFGSVLADVAGAVPGVDIETETAQRNLGTYTGRIKAGAQGRMSQEGETGLRSTQITPPTAMQTVSMALDRPTAYMEEITGRFSAALASRVADRAGLTGRMKNDYISDVIAQMQSEYHHESRAEVLRNPVLNALFPAQSFAVEVGQNVSRAAGGKQIAKLFAGMAVANLLYQFANNYKDFTDKDELGLFAWDMVLDNLEMAIPYSSAITGRGPSDGRTYAAAILEDVLWHIKYTKKAEEYRAAGDMENAKIYYERAANEIVKNFLPVGGQISRVVSADAMRRRGIISAEEFPQAATFGWWTTDGGQNYLRRLAGLEKAESKTTKRGVSRPGGVKRGVSRGGAQRRGGQ